MGVFWGVDFKYVGLEKLGAPPLPQICPHDVPMGQKGQIGLKGPLSATNLTSRFFGLNSMVQASETMGHPNCPKFAPMRCPEDKVGHIRF